MIDHYQKEKKSNWIKEDEIGEKIMTKFVWLKAKTYGYLKDNGSEDKTAKGTKNVCHRST